MQVENETRLRLDELPALSSATAREEYFARHPELLCGSTVEHLAQEATRLLRMDLDRAAQLIDTALWTAKKVGDPHSRGKALRALANLAHLQGRQGEALEHYSAARELFETSGDRLESAITASSSLQALTFVGDYDKAFSEADYARRVFEESGDRLRLARLNLNYGGILHRRDRWAEAAKYYEAAYHDFVEAGDAQDVAVCLANMATCHEKRQNFDQAVEFYERTRHFCGEHGLSALVAEVDYNIAYLYYLRGQYTKALELYRETRERHIELGNRHHVDLCALDEAEIYLELNLTAESADLAQQAFSGFQERGLSVEAAKALTTWAIALNRQGRSFLSLDVLRQAQELFRREQNDVWAAMLDYYRAVVLLRAGRPFEAKKLAAEALESLSSFGLSVKSAACHVLLARIALDQRSLDEGRERCLSALTALTSADAPHIAYQSLYLLGRIEAERGDFAAARRALLDAHERLERTGAAPITEEQKVDVFEDKLVVYESLVELLVQQAVSEPDKAEVLAFMEKAKSKSLTDLLAFRAHLLPSPQAGRSKLADQVRQLREELNWYYRQIDLQEMRSDDQSNRDVQALRAYGRQQETRLIRTLSELHQSDQEFSSLQEAYISPTETVRASLGPDTALVEYYIARDTVYAAVLSRRSLEVVPLTPASAARELCDQLLSALSRSDVAGDSESPRSEPAAGSSLQCLEALYDELLAPLTDLLDGFSSLLIVPHGFLYYLPFHALRDRGEYLIDRYAISYAPSATIFQLSKSKERADPVDEILVFAPSGDASAISSLLRGLSLPSLGLLTGADANEDSLQRLGRDARILHVATRGRFRRDNPMFSSLDLGQGDLYLFDLFQLRLSADLVALTGCGPGHDASGKGEELVGLVRGFLYAGARSVLTTLWNVDEIISSRLASSFYQRILAGSPKAEALRFALSELKRFHPDPRDWAAFVLHGEN